MLPEPTDDPKTQGDQIPLTAELMDEMDEVWERLQADREAAKSLGTSDTLGPDE